MTTDPEILARLDELLLALRAAPDPRRAGEQWRQVYKLLQKTDLPAGRVAAAVGMRNPAGLAELVEQLRAGGGPPAQHFDPEKLRQALRAFRKRQTLTQLDEDSQLGRGPLSKGAAARPAPIVPPSEWPEALWQELVRQGKLRYVGQGFYDLGEH